LPVSPDPVRIPAMKIRSITCFIDPSFPLKTSSLNLTGNFLKVAQPAYADAGYEVQSARLASVPFSRLIPQDKYHALPEFAQQFEAAAKDQGYAYVSLGPAMPDFLKSYASIPDALAGTQDAFFSGSITTANGIVSLSAIHQCASIIQQSSSLSAEGFANLRFAALANVPAGSPFFPAAYHHGDDPSFALATEAADLAVSAFSRASSLEHARQNLVQSIEAHSATLMGIARIVERQTKIRFGGIDFSLAPFPSEERSLAAAMERLGVPSVGGHGSLAAAAILADTLDQANFPRAGFSGLILPVLEDAILAQRVAQGNLDVKDLLLYSAVCGTGLDTVPLPGDVTCEQLAAVLVDLASLSSRLGKPLTARLMPIPGKKAGDPTEFEFAYFTNSRVLPLSAEPLNRFLAGSESFLLNPRARR
jgi:uncharacterized protein (UPF0210 family)